jgi:hypothetical protein
MSGYRFRDTLLNASYERAFSYIADPSNLPEWTEAFEAATDQDAVLRTPAGSLDIGLQVNASQEHGTIDWIMSFPDGSESTAFSRLVSLDGGISHFGFVLTPPPGPLEELEGALEQQAAILEGELARLKTQLSADD